MAYWSIAVLIFSISFLAYKHPPAQLEPITRWLRPGRRRGKDVQQNGTPVPAISTSMEDDSDEDNDHVNGVRIDVTEPVETDTTPKAAAVEPKITVPSLSLNGSTPEESKQPRLPKPPAPLFPGVERHQQALNAARSPKEAPSVTLNGTLNMMPPPARPALATPASPAAALRVPSTAPLPNRGPPANSQQRISSSLAPTATIGVPKARGKVLLAPGHSPMDWAALTKTKNLSGVSALQRVTPSMLKSMTGRKGKPAWTSWQGRVYNVTPYLPFHPGGEAELIRAAGRDATKLFMEVHPWVNWENMLGSCMVGVLVSENDVASSLDALD